MIEEAVREFLEIAEVVEDPPLDLIDGQRLVLQIQCHDEELLLRVRRLSSGVRPGSMDGAREEPLERDVRVYGCHR